MPKKQAPDWKLKAKKSDLSPKELQWQEKAREETLRKNFEARQRRAERAKAGDTLVIPEDVEDWFDRARVALLAATDDSQGAGGKVSKAPRSEAEQITRSYISQKFERRGISAFSLMMRIMEADPRAERGVGHARAILEKELVGVVAVQKVDEAKDKDDADAKKELNKNKALEVEQGMNKGPRMAAPLRVLSVGAGCGSELAGLVWASKYFFKTRPISCLTLHQAQESGKGWKKSRVTLTNFIEQTPLLPPLKNEISTLDIGLPLHRPDKRAPSAGMEAQGALEDEATVAKRRGMEEAARRRAEEGGGSEHAGGGSEPGGGMEGEEGEQAQPAGEGGSAQAEDSAAQSKPKGGENEAEDEDEEEEEVEGTWVNARAVEAISGPDGADLLMFSYSLYESGVCESHMEFFKQAAVAAKTEAAFLFIDVQNRSQPVFDKVYEAMLAALEAVQPKNAPKKHTLTPDKALQASDAEIQEMLLSLGPSHAAILRMFRSLSLGVHPDKNEGSEEAQQAFNRLKDVKETVIRGHELIKQEDGTTLLAPLSVYSSPPSGTVSEGLLLRFDIPPSESCKAEVMLLVKGPVDLKAKEQATSSLMRGKREKGGVE